MTFKSGIVGAGVMATEIGLVMGFMPKENVAQALFPMMVMVVISFVVGFFIDMV
jgi:hypothetical protein